MAEIVNLRIARKRAAKAEREATADANRAAFGLPKSLTDKSRIEAARAAARLDGARLDGPRAAASSAPETPEPDRR